MPSLAQSVGETENGLYLIGGTLESLDPFDSMVEEAN
jgi:hypothetical protein